MAAESALWARLCGSRTARGSSCRPFPGHLKLGGARTRVLALCPVVVTVLGASVAAGAHVQRNLHQRLGDDSDALPEETGITFLIYALRNILAGLILNSSSIVLCILLVDWSLLLEIV